MNTDKNTEKKRRKKKMTYRFNLVLHGDLAARFIKEPHKSQLVQSCLKDMYERKEKEKFEKELATAYKESAEEDRKIAQEWDSTTGDEF